MLRARLREFVSACKDVILLAREERVDFIDDDSDDDDSYGATDDMVVHGSFVNPNNSVESEYIPVAAIKRPWPLSWIPPKHLRHPDWEYEKKMFY